jgi:hypothetical protein
MARNELYQIHKVKDRHYKCLKFDMDYTPKNGGYEISTIPGRGGRLVMECSCFASNRETCRHRKMLEMAIKENKVGGGWYYDFDRGVWHSPAIDIEL